MPRDSQKAHIAAGRGATEPRVSNAAKLLTERCVKPEADGAPEADGDRCGYLQSAVNLVISIRYSI